MSDVTRNPYVDWDRWTQIVRLSVWRNGWNDHCFKWSLDRDLPHAMTFQFITAIGGKCEVWVNYCKETDLDWLTMEIDSMSNCGKFYCKNSILTMRGNQEFPVIATLRDVVVGKFIKPFDRPMHESLFPFSVDPCEILPNCQ